MAEECDDNNRHVGFGRESMANLDQTHTRRDFQTSENIQLCASLDFGRTINSYSIHATRARALWSREKSKRDAASGSHRRLASDASTSSIPSGNISGDISHSASTTNERTGLLNRNEKQQGHRKNQSSLNSIMVDVFSDDDPFLHTQKTNAMDKRRKSVKPFVTFDPLELATLSEDSATFSFDSLDSGMNGADSISGGGGRHRVNRTLKISTLGHVVAKWIFTCIVGLLVGLAAVVIVDGVGRISSFRTAHLNRQFATVYGYEVAGSEGSENVRPLINPQHTFGLFIVFAVSSFIPAFLSGWMCVYMAPGAPGSGIPEVKAYLNGVRVKSFAQFNLLFVKIVGTILSVSSGLAIGPEGPLVHIGAIIGASVTKTGWIFNAISKFNTAYPRLGALLGCGSIGTTYGTALRKLEAESEGKEIPKEENWEKTRFSRGLYSASRIFTTFFFNASFFRNDSERRDFITIGSAAGFAAAFGAPVGGVLYGLEETSTFFATSLLWKTLNATAIATFCIAVYHGGLDKFSVLTLNVSKKSEDLGLNRFEHIHYYMLVGLVGGLLGALFNSTILYVSEKRKEFFANATRSTHAKEKCRLLEVALLSVFTSTTIFFLPLVMPHACTMVTNPEEQSVWQMNCKPGEYNEVANIMLGTRDDAILNILTDTESYQPNNLLAVGLIFFLLQVATFGVSLPSGIFMPTILTGASLGGYLGFFLQRYDPSVSPSVFALLGAAALLSGMQRTTVSLCVILMEGTGQTEVLIPVIITVVVACYIGNLFNHGIYEVVMELKEFPYLEQVEGKHVYDMFGVKNVMSAPVVVINSVECAGTIESLLLETTHNGFPVVDKKTKQFVGLVRRDQLVALLETGVFMKRSKKANGVSAEEEAGESSAAIHRGLFHDNSVSISFVERNPEIVTKALQIRDDRYGSVIEDNGCWDRCCPTLFSSRDTYFSALAPEARSELHKEHEWLAATIDTAPTGDGAATPPRTDHTLPRRKVMQGYDFDDDDDEPAEQPIVDIDMNRNVVIHLPESVRTREVNVEAVMNRGAHIVLEGCPLTTAYELFTKMGLRHLTVLGGADKGRVVGMVTRHNLMTEHLEEATGFKLH